MAGFSTMLPQFLMIKFIVISSVWSLFAHVTGFRPRVLTAVFLVAFHIALSVILTPFLFIWGVAGEITIAGIYYLILLFFIDEDSPVIEKVFFAFYPPVLYGIIFNFIARMVFPYIFDRSFYQIGTNFVWCMSMLIAVNLAERFLREFFQINYVALKENIWLDAKTRRNFWYCLIAVASYFVIQQVLSIGEAMQVQHVFFMPFTVVYNIFTLIYLGILIQILITTDYYSREYLKFLREQEQQHYLENLENYSQQLEELYQSVRSFRHDYNNVLLSLRTSINSGDIEQVSKVFDDIFRDNIGRLETRDFQTQLVNVAVPEIKSFLYLKMNEYESNQRKFMLDISELLLDYGVTSSIGLMVLTEMFNRVKPMTDQNPDSILTLKIAENDGVQKFILGVTPYDKTLLSGMNELSLKSQKMLNHYQELSFSQGIHETTFIQELDVRRLDDK